MANDALTPMMKQFYDLKAKTPTPFCCFAAATSTKPTPTMP